MKYRLMKYPLPSPSGAKDWKFLIGGKFLSEEEVPFFKDHGYIPWDLHSHGDCGIIELPEGAQIIGVYGWVDFGTGGGEGSSEEHLYYVIPVDD